MKENYLIWEVDQEIGEEEATAVLDAIESQVRDQTDERIEIGEIQRCDPSLAGAAFTFIIGVSSAVTAQCIMNALNEHEGTRRTERRPDLSEEDDRNVTEHEEDVTINLDITVDSEE